MAKVDKELQKAFKAGFAHGAYFIDWFQFHYNMTNEFDDFVDRMWDKDIFEHTLSNEELRLRIKEQLLTKLPPVGFTKRELPKRKSMLKRIFE